MAIEGAGADGGFAGGADGGFAGGADGGFAGGADGGFAGDVDGVYRSEVEKLTAATQRFAATMPPLEALRAWMLLFIDHVASKVLILPAMDTVAGGSMRLIEGARGHIHSDFLALVQRAIRSGDLRPDTEPNDFVHALVGVFHTTALPGWESSARRIVDILIADSRPR